MVADVARDGCEVKLAQSSDRRPAEAARQGEQRGNVRGVVPIGLEIGQILLTAGSQVQLSCRPVELVSDVV